MPKVLVGSSSRLRVLAAWYLRIASRIFLNHLTGAGMTVMGGERGKISFAEWVAPKYRSGSF
ncbi:hypothetical protein SAMN06298226_1707 [Nitrosovibrio sp. Nv4]|nr:hypothetical protein SAMN06298226_1707 [Nitrosovibrio sp. Nv4]